MLFAEGFVNLERGSIRRSVRCVAISCHLPGVAWPVPGLELWMDRRPVSLSCRLHALA